MKLDKKVIAIGVLTTFVAAGTAFAAIRTSTTTESITIGSRPAVTISSTTTETVSASSKDKTVTVISQSPETVLANVIFRILGIPVTVQEVTVLKTRSLGNGEVALVYSLAQSSGRSVSDILDMRFERKMGWGRIAKELGVKLKGASDQSVVILQEAQLYKDADDFNISIRVDLDDEDKDHVDKNKKSDNELRHKNGKDDEEDGKGNGKGHKKH